MATDISVPPAPLPPVPAIEQRDLDNLRKLVRGELALHPDSDATQRYTAQNLIELIEASPHWRDAFDAAVREVKPSSPPCDSEAVYLDLLAVFFALPEPSTWSPSEIHAEPPGPAADRPLSEPLAEQLESEFDCLPVLSLRYGAMPRDEKRAERFKKHEKK